MPETVEAIDNSDKSQAVLQLLYGGDISLPIHIWQSLQSNVDEFMSYARNFLREELGTYVILENVEKVIGCWLTQNYFAPNVLYGKMLLTDRRLVWITPKSKDIVDLGSGESRRQIRGV